MVVLRESVIILGYIYTSLPDIGIMVKVFTNGPGDLGSIPGWIITETQKWHLMAPCLILSIIRDGSRVKWSNPGKGIAPSPTSWCSSYRKGRLGITLDYVCLLYLLPIFTNISAREGYDTRSIFKRSLADLNSEFSFSYTNCLDRAEEPSLAYYLPIAGWRIIGFIPFPKGISGMWNAISLVKDSNSCRHVLFLRI